MAINTKHYGLTAFGQGDIYSATVDRKRFTIIDNQIEFLSEAIGDGVIEGWRVTDDGSLDIETDVVFLSTNNILFPLFFN